MARVELELPTPYLNAAGALGFSPPARGSQPAELGIFVTNPISASARTPAGSRAALAYPGGCLLHTGLPNPGLRAVLKKHAPLWARYPYPVWAHLIPATPFEAAGMARELENLENIGALEIGLQVNSGSAAARELLEAAAGELPVVAALPLDAPPAWYGMLKQAGVSALTLSAPRGVLPGPAGQVAGRLYGPGLLPLVFPALSRARQQNLPVIAGAGVWSRAAALALLGAGAAAVQLDGVLWNPGKW